MSYLNKAGKITKVTLAALTGLLTIGAFQAKASIIELKLTSPVFSVGGVFGLPSNPYILAGDIAKYTVRYDTTTALSDTINTASWSSGIYNGAVTYFEFELERAGTTVYSGSTSGNFGRVRVTNDNPVAPSTFTDFLTIDLFDDDNRYDFHGLALRDPTLTEMPPLPRMSSGDAVNGDILLESFKLNFHGTSKTIWPDTNLPDMVDLAGTPFATKFGNSPWSAHAIFPDSTNPFLNNVGFGYGAETPKGTGPWGNTFSASEFTGGGQTGGVTPGGDSTIPEPNMLLLLGLGLITFGVSRRKKD